MQAIRLLSTILWYLFRVPRCRRVANSLSAAQSLRSQRFGVTGRWFFQ